jgi:hypothetical protein
MKVVSGHERVSALLRRHPEDGPVDLIPKCLSSQEENRLRSAPLGVAPLSKWYGAPGEDDARGWQELASEGYTIKAFLGQAEIEALQQLRIATIPEVPSGIYMSFLSSLETRRAILEGCQTILKDKLKTLAPGFSIVSATLVTKKAGGKNGRLGLHQDSSLVDHSKDLGMNVWVPLCDVDDHNGCLRVAGRSHRFNLIGFLPPLPGPHVDYETTLVSPCVTSLVLKAGEACLFDSRLLHGSDENHSDSDRVALFLTLIPEDRLVRMHFRNPETPAQLDVYQVDSEFLLHLDPFRHPGAATLETQTFLESFGHVQQKLCEADFAALHADVAVPAEAPAALREAVAPVPVAPVAAVMGSKAEAVSSSFWKGLGKRFQH